MSPKRLTPRLLAAFTATAALMAGAGSAAAAPASQRFWVSARGSQTTTWAEPRHSTYKDCYNDYWYESNGSETLKFTARPEKLLVTRLPGFVQVQFGTWNLTGQPPDVEWTAGGTLTRAAHRATGAGPGLCGTGGRPTQDAGPFDCGTRSAHWATSLILTRGRAALSLGPAVAFAPVTPQTFETCPIAVGEGAAPGGLTQIFSKLPTAELMDSSLGRLIVLGRKTMRYSSKTDLGFGGRLTAATTVRWTLTLQRVRSTR